jgi:predicted enzyme related to lactoylglutathione lyase
MFRYIHTNIIAKNASKLIDFYKMVFHCKSINETRDLCGAWLDKLTGLNEAHITGGHLPIARLWQRASNPRNIFL